MFLAGLSHLNGKLWLFDDAGHRNGEMRFRCGTEESGLIVANSFSRPTRIHGDDGFLHVHGLEVWKIFIKIYIASTKHEIELIIVYFMYYLEWNNAKMFVRRRVNQGRADR